LVGFLPSIEGRQANWDCGSSEQISEHKTIEQTLFGGKFSPFYIKL
jgi:hypothetical protein